MWVVYGGVASTREESRSTLTWMAGLRTCPGRLHVPLERPGLLGVVTR